MLDEVYEVMDRMDQRLNTLERILDEENSDWRKDDPYGDRPNAPEQPKGDYPRPKGDYPREVS